MSEAMMKPMTILVATDGSSEAAEACRFLGFLPLPSGSVLHVVSAVHVPPATVGHPAPWQTIEYLFECQEAWAEKALHEAETLLAREGVRIETAIPRGDPAPQILQMADAIDAELVVLGAHGLTGPGSFLGSVARNVAKRCRRPVLIARTPYNALREVVVATDGSKHAMHALQFTSRLPLPEGSKLTLVHVVRPHRPFHPLLPGRKEQFEQAAAELLQRQEAAGRELLAAAGALLDAGPGAVRQELRFGDPAGEILRVAGEYDTDLIVAGARGVSLLEGLLMGSVADRLVKQAGCSVLIVH
jgi:nucleotide-binding universal stress UspA family protein